MWLWLYVIISQGFFGLMVIHGEKWGALHWLIWETLEWAREHVRTRLLKNVNTSLMFSRNLKVQFSLFKLGWTSIVLSEMLLKYLYLFLVTGEAFDTTQPINCAVSNIICSIVYGHRFEYNDSQFTTLVYGASRNIRILGSASIQVVVFGSLYNCSSVYNAWIYKSLMYVCQMYEMFPSLFKWIANRKEFFKTAAANSKQNLAIIRHLKETLNPEMCRCFVDAFLVRKKHLEVSFSIIHFFLMNN